jgi:hypothetical protein
MAERSVAWDTGEAISGTPFRHMIKAADTGSRFSAQLAVVKAGELIIPHSHRDEDEFSFVFRGRIGGRVATTTWWLRSGSISSHAASCTHGGTRPTSVPQDPPPNLPGAGRGDPGHRGAVRSPAAGAALDA